MQDNKAYTDQATKWFLKEYVSRWTKWVPAEVVAKVKAAL